MRCQTFKCSGTPPLFIDTLFPPSFFPFPGSLALFSPLQPSLALSSPHLTPNPKCYRPRSKQPDKTLPRRHLFRTPCKRYRTRNLTACCLCSRKHRRQRLRAGSCCTRWCRSKRRNGRHDRRGASTCTLTRSGDRSGGRRALGWKRSS